MEFLLHRNLEHKIFLIDLPLCRVLLEDNKDYPWLFLIPRETNISRIMDLSMHAQMQLLKELDFVQRLLWEEFQPTQLNIAAIGNKTSQLHIHVIARFQDDPAWPQTVWDYPHHKKYDEKDKSTKIQRLQDLLKDFKNRI